MPRNENYLKETTEPDRTHPVGTMTVEFKLAYTKLSPKNGDILVVQQDHENLLSAENIRALDQMIRQYGVNLLGVVALPPGASLWSLNEEEKSKLRASLYPTIEADLSLLRSLLHKLAFSGAVASVTEIRDKESPNAVLDKLIEFWRAGHAPPPPPPPEPR